MIGVLGYVLGCVLVATLLTVVVALLRPIRNQAEFKSWRWGAFFFLAAMVGPYVHAEVLTRLFGAPMRAGVVAVVEESGVAGELVYFRVVKFTGDRARVVAVADDEADWGLPERAVIAIELRRQDGAWEPDRFNFVTSVSRGHDSVSLPPYW